MCPQCACRAKFGPLKHNDHAAIQGVARSTMRPATGRGDLGCKHVVSETKAGERVARGVWGGLGPESLARISTLQLTAGQEERHCDRRGGGLASTFKPCLRLRQGLPLVLETVRETAGSLGVKMTPRQRTTLIRKSVCTFSPP